MERSQWISYRRLEMISESQASRLPFLLSLGVILTISTTASSAGELIVKLPDAEGVTFVGAIDRWDADGNTRKPVDASAKIDQPAVTARAQSQDGKTWTFRNLPAGRYDIIILKKGRIRVEGFHYPPVLEFDPVLSSTASAPDVEAARFIVKHIADTPRYENKVKALALAGDKKAVRLFVQLVRDQPTSYDSEVGYPVATVRHEVWQYTFKYGTWSREKAAKILDRILLPKAEFHQWTWVWEKSLGGIEVGKQGTVTVEYRLPLRFESGKAMGWFPETK
jgi:hypothetical protein